MFLSKQGFIEYLIQLLYIIIIAMVKNYTLKLAIEMLIFTSKYMYIFQLLILKPMLSLPKF